MKCKRCRNLDGAKVFAGSCPNPQGGEWGSLAPCYCACHPDNRNAS